MNTQELLFRLLQQELWGGEDIIHIPYTSLESLRQFAKEQTVEALAMHPIASGKALVDFAPNQMAEKEKMALRLAMTEAQSKRLHTKFLKILQSLNAVMREEHIPYVVFKGAASASHYPHPFLRTMGDVDFYVPPSHFRQAVNVIEQKMQVEIERDELEKHYAFDYEGVRFELHYQIETFGRRRHQRIFHQWIDHEMAHLPAFDAYGCPISMLPPEADIVLVFKHMFNHLLIEGVGLRQLCDVAVLLEAYKAVVNASHLRQMLKEVGYLNAFEACVAMLDRYLSLPCSNIYASLDSRKYSWGDKLMQAILKSGNFGRSNYKNQTEGVSKSLETACIAFGHCTRFLPLAPNEISALMVKRIGISAQKNFHFRMPLFGSSRKNSDSH